MVDFDKNLGDLKCVKHRLIEQLKQRIVGLDDVIEMILTAFFANGHCLLEGPSGIAKSCLVEALAASTELSFKRIQFTMDLMPSDIIGMDLIDEDENGRRRLQFHRGPIFANVVLADEINRSPPKTQAALLQAMQEGRISVGRSEYILENPFVVLATQNPLDQEGTYPLPEAQLDRFLFKLDIPYPSLDEEMSIIERATTTQQPDITPVIHRIDLIRCIQTIKSIPIPTNIKERIVRMVQLSRPDCSSVRAVRQCVATGAGPRASIAIARAAQTRAAFRGSKHVGLEDVLDVALPALRHRLVINFHGEAEGIKPDYIIRDLVKDSEV